MVIPMARRGADVTEFRIPGARSLAPISSRTWSVSMVGRRPPGWAELGSPRARLVLALLISLSIGGEWLFASILRPARADEGARAGSRCVVNAWSISRAALRGGEWFQRRFVERTKLAREPAAQRDPVDAALDDALRASSVSSTSAVARRP